MNEASASTVVAPAIGLPARMPVSPRRDDDATQEPVQRLMRLHGPGELKAALLAIVRTPGSRREFNAWRDEVSDVPSSDAIRHDLDVLDPAARMPWFELFCKRLAEAPPLQRKQVAEAVRRVMRADGRVRPIDRLLWLAVRRQLGEAKSALAPAQGDNDLSALTPDQVAAVAKYSAFISRLIPQREVDAALDDQSEPPGERWFRVVMSNWPAMTAVRQPVDGDALLRALRLIQSLPWMLRPVLVRAWYEAATELSEGRPLASEAADALRLTCLLLDSPMPEGLARQFIEPADR
jgi:hypothetical protein